MHSRKQTLTFSAVQRYIKAEDILRQHHDSSDDDIERFQTEVDHFMCEWVDLYVLTGLSNYIHMFTSVHFMWFMGEYHNLHQLNQQGLESMNASVTSIFFRRAQRGGFLATNNPKYKLLPIAHWLNWGLLWLCYSHEEIFIDGDEINTINTSMEESELIALGYGLDE
jgi:hypothetical protein